MALKAKVRGKWRNVSAAMARVYRKRGVEVVDDSLSPEALAFLDREAGLARERLHDHMRAVAKIESRIMAPSEPLEGEAPPDAALSHDADDLTDEELERLTAPE